MINTNQYNSIKKYISIVFNHLSLFFFIHLLMANHQFKKRNTLIKKTLTYYTYYNKSKPKSNLNLKIKLLKYIM